MTESLFDTKFASENSSTIASGMGIVKEKPVHMDDHNEDRGNNMENDEGGESALPSVDDDTNSAALINFRVLISAKESGCLIGQNGSVIDSIREETNTKAEISKLQPGTNMRILTVSGTLDNCAKALSYFAQALCNASVDNITKYNYFPLKQLSPIECIPGKTTILRLIIANAQMGTLIGAKGARIQEIQAKYHVSMIASKSFLEDSNERLLELQGTVDNLYDALRVIARCLIEVFSSIVGTQYYIPKPLGQKGKRSVGQRALTETLTFPNDVVGALIGKNGSRIQGVRKVSGAKIAISDEIEGVPERSFTITGTPQSMEKAKSLLFHNLEREQKRRAELSEQAQ